MYSANASRTPSNRKECEKLRRIHEEDMLAAREKHKDLLSEKKSAEKRSAELGKELAVSQERAQKLTGDLESARQQALELERRFEEFSRDQASNIPLAVRGCIL